MCCSGEEGRVSRRPACPGVRLRVGEHAGPGWVSGRVCVRPYPSTVRCCLKKSFAANLMAFSGVTSVRFTAAPGWRTTRGAEHSLNYGTTSLCPLKLQMGIFVLVSNNWFATAHSSAQMSNTTVKWQIGVERVAQGHLNSVCQQKPEGSNRRPQFTEWPGSSEVTCCTETSATQSD